ncbi:hypothetical protein FRC09_002080, partial [Ceratobasidium sp. 395]
MSGDFVIPKLPSPGGTPYVWPALQSGNGVLQAVCDGRRRRDEARRGGEISLERGGLEMGFMGRRVVLTGRGVVWSLPWGNGFNVKP